MRGVKGSKVLRTRKVKTNTLIEIRNNSFCSNHCQNDFWNKHARDMLPLHRGPSALKQLMTQRKQDSSNYGSQWYPNTEIKVDETRQR